MQERGINMGKEKLAKILFSTGTLVLYFGYLLLTQIIFSNDITPSITTIGFLVTILFLFLFVFLYNRKIKSDFIDYKKQKPFCNTLFYFLLTCFSFITGIVILIICQIKYTNSLLEQFTLLPGYTCFNLLVSAPIVEAIVFGAALRNAINQKWLYVLTSGLVYGVLNAVFMTTGFNIVSFTFPFILAGISLAVTYVKTNNLILYIIVNCLFDVGLLLVLLI